MSQADLLDGPPPINPLLWWPSSLQSKMNEPVSQFNIIFFRQDHCTMISFDTDELSAESQKLLRATKKNSTIHSRFQFVYFGHVPNCSFFSSESWTDILSQYIFWTFSNNNLQTTCDYFVIQQMIIIQQITYIMLYFKQHIIMLQCRAIVAFRAMSKWTSLQKECQLTTIS